MRREADHGRVALVTGASRGIGFELAKLLAGDGWELALVAKPQDELEGAGAWLREHYPVVVHCLPLDLAEPGSPQAVHDWCQRLGLAVHILVNNAGIAAYGPFQAISLERDCEMIQVNAAAPVALCKLFMPQMLARDQGRILNMSSAAGLPPLPTMACYAATKSLVYSFSRALSHELRRITRNVTVTVLCPAATRSPGFIRQAGMEGSKAFRVIESQTPEAVARAGYRALMRGRAVAFVPAWYGWVVQLCNRLLPTEWMMRIVAARIR